MEGNEGVVSPTVMYSFHCSALLQTTQKQPLNRGRIVLAHIFRGISAHHGGEVIGELMGARMCGQDPHILMEQEAETTARMTSSIIFKVLTLVAFFPQPGPTS